MIARRGVNGSVEGQEGVEDNAGGDSEGDNGEGDNGEGGDAGGDGDGDDAGDHDESDGDASEGDSRSDSSEKSDPRAGGKRRRRDVCVGKRARQRVDSDSSMSVSVPALSDIHSTWKEFAAYLDAYMKSTHTRIVVSEIMSVRIRNKQLADTLTGKAGTAIMVPDSMECYQRRYICTHGWRLKTGGRKSARGSKRLPNQAVNSTGCTFRFAAQASLENDTWLVRVKHQVLTHNHPVNREVFGNYPAVRRVPPESLLMQATVNIVSIGGKKAEIYDYIREHSNHSDDERRGEPDPASEGRRAARSRTTVLCLNDWCN